MDRRLPAAVGALLLLLLAWWAVTLQHGGVEAGEVRSLSRYRIEKLPARLPEAWRHQLDQALAAAPAVRLLDPQAPAAAAAALRSLPWIDPDSVEARLQLPDGIAVDFRPRRLGVAVLCRGRYTVVALDGTVLPEGLPTASLAFLARVPLADPEALPEPGLRVADPLVQEALRAVYEFDAAREVLAGDLVAIERQPGYPPATPGVPPALAFVTRRGCRLHWGRSAASRDPFGVPAELKLRRLAAVLRFRPGLAGLAHVVLDGPRVRLYDQDGGEVLPPPELR
ncbi:MAG: hypothetical protein D6702_12045 [Planctomycetota bacterium]|nr:MAG: hypothetical protein D6702_12045 [Planctomycetota bacterium]